MKIGVQKCIVLNACVLAVSGSPNEKENTVVAGKVENDSPRVLQYNNTHDKSIFFGINWKSINTNVSSNWLIIAVSSLVILIVLWWILLNIKKKLHEWKKSFVQKDKTFNYSRRLTLPDLTLAKHARRESLADATQKLTNCSRILSQCNSSQNGNVKQNLIERNDNISGDVKRVHKIRRRY